MAIDPSNILLTGRVAVITGGGEGIGRGIAEGLTAFGASVAIWEQNAETCKSTAETIGGLGIVTDVRDSEQVDAALQRTTSQLGTPSILVNNAGGVFRAPLLETSENGWDALYRSNLRHVLLCTQRIAGRLVEPASRAASSKSRRSKAFELRPATRRTPRPRLVSSTTPRPRLSSWHRTIFGSTRSLLTSP